MVSLPGSEGGGTGVRWTDGGRGIVSTFTTGHIVRWELVDTGGGTRKAKCGGIYGVSRGCYGSAGFPPRGFEDEGIVILSYGQDGRVYAYSGLAEGGVPISASAEGKGEIYDMEVFGKGDGGGDVWVAVGGRGRSGVEVYKIKGG